MSAFLRENTVLNGRKLQCTVRRFRTDMGSLCKDAKSKCWYWSWTNADGRRLKTSTKIEALPSLREEAEAVGRAFEKIDDLARREIDVDNALRKVIAETLRKIGKPPFDDPSVAQWLERWLGSQHGAVSEATLKRYQSAISHLCRILGSRKDIRLSAMTGSDIKRFRDGVRTEGRSAATVNLLLGVIRSALKDAIRNGLLDREPGMTVRYLKVTETEKSVFSPGEVARLVEAATGEWRTMILLGYFTGQRLSDLARLSWADIDLDQGRILFLQKKTSKRLATPIHAELAEYLLGLPTPESANQVLLPNLSLLPPGGHGGLSRAFKVIMERAGVGNAIAHMRDGKAGRNTSARSFHSLRHTHISALMNKDVSPEIRQRISGHSSSRVHSGYSHAEWETLDKSVQSIERLPKR